jgi:hypothetical protein
MIFYEKRFKGTAAKKEELGGIYFFKMPKQSE